MLFIIFFIKYLDIIKIVHSFFNISGMFIPYSSATTTHSYSAVFYQL
jgi:hypothetical protein